MTSAPDLLHQEEAKLKADVARVIDGEPWKAMEDGRDAIEGSMWWLRREWALEKASQIIALVSETRIRDLEERLEKQAEIAKFCHDRATALTAERDSLAEKLGKAEEALEPFANSDMAPDIYDDDSCVAGSCDFTCADIRHARTTLSQIRSEK